jgi:hypothetical protein
MLKRRFRISSVAGWRRFKKFLRAKKMQSRGNTFSISTRAFTGTPLAHAQEMRDRERCTTTRRGDRRNGA